MRRRRTRSVKGECVIPPVIPDTALPDLIVKRDLDAEASIRRYVEWQGKEQVTHAERIRTEYALGQKYDAWDVRTTKGRWWVITTPTNLYSQELFPSLDYTISFHVGVTARVMSRSRPGVEPMEAALLPAAWRKWQQANEALDEAEEPEDFQAVGMRCRESLIAMMHKLGTPEMVRAGDDPPKRSDVPGWADLIANHVARGGSAKYVRGYMKAVAKSGWDVVNWLTHASGATKADAVLALEATQHLLATFGTAVFRHAHGIPDRCPNCGSYQIGLRRSNPDRDDSDAVAGCRACDWMEPTTNSVNPR
jgi:hypothetical protein